MPTGTGRQCRQQPQCLPFLLEQAGQCAHTWSTRHEKSVTESARRAPALCCAGSRGYLERFNIFKMITEYFLPTRETHVDNGNLGSHLKSAETLSRREIYWTQKVLRARGCYFY